MFDGYKRKKMEQVARRFLESEQASVMLGIFTEAERTILESVQEQREAIGLDGDVNDLPSKEDRAEQMRQVALAKMNGRLPEHVVEMYYGDVLEHPTEAAEHADLSEDEWQTQKQEWADKLREQGATGSDTELAQQFVQLRFDVDLQQFYQMVVNWPDGREGREIESIVASGLRTANLSINKTTEHLEEADINVEATGD